MAGRTDRTGHWLWLNCRHCYWYRWRPDRKLVATSFGHPSWIRNCTGDHRSYDRGDSPAFDSKTRLSARSLVIKRRKVMAMARRKRATRRDWTRDEVKELKKHSKDKTRVKTISRTLKRTPAAVRQKAQRLG